MDYYIDISLQPGEGFADTVVMNELFYKFHLNMVHLRMNSIGISFPKKSKTLGNLLRLHGKREDLEKFMSSSWIGSIKHHVSITPIWKVPAGVQYCIVKRVQPKSCKARLLRRSVRKGWISEEMAKQQLETQVNEISNLPFLRVRSHSSDQRFCLFIDHDTPKDNPAPGEFSFYGLSSTATVPMF